LFIGRREPGVVKFGEAGFYRNVHANAAFKYCRGGFSDAGYVRRIAAMKPLDRTDCVTWLAEDSQASPAINDGLSAHAL
jgi:hypothetical protein